MSGEANGSPLDGLRRAYARRRRGSKLDLPVPGWDGELVARIQVPDDGFVERIQGAPGTPDWMADFVAETVAGLYRPNGVGDDGTVKLEPLPGGSAGQPLRFTAAFGEAIGAEDVKTPRAAVFAAFMDGGDEDTYPVLNLLALGEFADSIERWLSNTSRSIAGAIVSGS